MRPVLLGINLCLFAVSVSADEAAYRCAPDEPMPVGLYGKDVGHAQTVHFDVPVDPAQIKSARLEMMVDDIDQPEEAKLTLNGKVTIKVDGGVLGEGAVHSGDLAVPVEHLVKGRNAFEFVFASDLDGTTAGYDVLEMALVIVIPAELAPKQQEQEQEVEPLAGRRIEPISGLPIALQKAKVGAAEAVAFRLPDDVEPKEAFLELLVADVDSTKEVQISVNKQGPVYLPQKVVARRTGHAAQVALNPKHLKPGGNVVSFKFADASEGERDGFGIDVAVLVVLHEPTAQPTYVTDGLVIHYDVTAGSMPDDKGAVMDISGNNLHGRMRSIGRGLDSVARRNDEYQIINRSGGSPDRVSEVRLSRKAWVDVPLNDQLLAIDGDGTFEFVVRVMPSGAMPQLMDFGSIRSDQRQLSHYIGFDFRGSNNGQYLFSDTRKVSEGPVHSVMVNKGGWPQPAPPGVQQIAYVVKDGKGRFLTNGLEHSIQSVRAGIERASMFKWVSDAAGGKPADVRLSLFAGVDAAGAGGGFMGGFIAVRLYDRPLSPGELRQNYQATIGVEPPSQRSMDVLARAINWSRPKTYLPREDRPITARTTPAVGATVIDFFDTLFNTDSLWTDDQTKSLMQKLKDNGFDTFYLRMGNGRAYWPSKVLDMYEQHDDDKEVYKRLHDTCRSMDVLESFVRWGKHFGLKMIYWQPIYDDETTMFRYAPGSTKYKKYGEYPLQSKIIREKPWTCWEHRDTWKDPDRGKDGRLADGYRRYWGGNLCYAIPDARQVRVEQCREIVEKYDMDGMAFSLRSHSVYAGWEKRIDQYGFNDVIVDEYKKRYGVDIRTQPFDRAKWRNLRGEGLTLMIRECHEVLVKSGKELHMMVTPPPGSNVQDYPYINDISKMLWPHVTLDWPTWQKEKLVNTYVFYGTSWEGYPTPWVRQVKAFKNAVRASGVPVIYFYRIVGGGRAPWDACETDIRQLWNDENLDGLIVYEMDNLIPGGIKPDSYGGKLMPVLKELFSRDP